MLRQVCGLANKIEIVVHVLGGFVWIQWVMAWLFIVTYTDTGERVSEIKVDQSSLTAAAAFLFVCLLLSIVWFFKKL